MEENNEIKKPNRFLELVFAVLAALAFFGISGFVVMVASVFAGTTLMVKYANDLETYSQKLAEYVLSPEFLMPVEATYQLIAIVVFGLWYYFGFIKRRSPEQKEQVKRKVFNANTLLTSIALGIGCLGLDSIIVMVVAIINPSIIESYEKLMETNFDLSSPIAWLSIIILAPVAEELAFRGVALGHLRKAWGMWGTVIITAVIFAIEHGNILQFLYVLPIGIILGIVGYKSESIIPTIVLHLVNNLFSCFPIPENIFIYLVMLIVGFALAFFMLTRGRNTEEDLH